MVLFFGILFSSICYAKTNNEFLKLREGFSTSIITSHKTNDELVEPPSKLLSIVKYDTKLGKMSAYLSKPQNPNKKYPAIIWITGGFPSGGAGSSVWENRPAENDQSAKSFWQNNIVSMYPSFRGTFGNPGQQEGFYGEVDDVLSALEYLLKLDYVDPNEIYLGGHSTGGTLALLVAAATDKFKSIFSFGPVADPANYGAEQQFHDPNESTENYLRAPINFLTYIKSPTYVIEGEVDGNLDSLKRLKNSSSGNIITYISIKNGNHFDILYPINRLIAKNISNSKELVVTQISAQQAFDDIDVSAREVDDLQVLAKLRESGTPLNTIIEGHYYLASMEESALKKVIPRIKNIGFSPESILKKISSDGTEYYLLVAKLKFSPLDLKATFENSKKIQDVASKQGVYYQGWYYH